MTTNSAATEVIYLDLDGDGVPDAVATRRVESSDGTGDGHADSIVTTTVIDSKIGIDGVPVSTETYCDTFVGGGVRRSA